MKKIVLITVLLVGSFGTGIFVNSLFAQKNEQGKSVTKKEEKKPIDLKLGAFSMSLSVKDLKTSVEFYEKLGFKTFGGAMEQNYVIMKNGNTLIGLFQGMFEGNMLTFNPGWNENAENVKKFDDVRVIQKHLKENGVALTTEAADSTSGPAFIMLNDPDGNVILLDQHR
jgi:catechol 2,3-dioxygenase-like lactoylglutathione lyase family enzyme